MGRHPFNESDHADRCTGGAGVKRHGMSNREYQDRLARFGALASGEPEAEAED